jgi:PEP-CTERM motif
MSMKRFFQITVAAGALAVATHAASAAEITWDFATSSYYLLTPPSTTTGPFSAIASGTNGAITPTNGQGAIFYDSSNQYFVGAYGWGSGTATKVTQSNNRATTVDGVHVTLNGLGVCNGSCTGALSTIGDTEWLAINLGSHPKWNLLSIVFGDVLANPNAQLEFWFDNDSTQSTAKNNKIDDTILQGNTAGTECVGGIGADHSCLFDFSALAIDPDAYTYLWVTAVNPNSTNANLQPAILVTALNGETIPVPEPSALALLGVSLLAFGVIRVRRDGHPLR